MVRKLAGGLAAAVCVFTAGLSACPAWAQTTVSPSGAGFIMPGLISSKGDGTYNIDTGNYSGNEARGYLTYAVPSSTTAYTSAVLNLNTWAVDGLSETLGVYEVTSNITSASDAALFTDFGDGTQFATVTGLDNASGTIQITLNPAGLAAVNAARGSTITFGFKNETNGDFADRIFRQSTGSTPRDLILTPTAVPPVVAVPTLSEWAMILLGLTLAGGAAVMIQRRRFAA